MKFFMPWLIATGVIWLAAFLFLAFGIAVAWGVVLFALIGTTIIYLGGVWYLLRFGAKKK